MKSIPTLAALCMATALPASVAWAGGQLARPRPYLEAQFEVKKGSEKEAALAKGTTSLDLKVDLFKKSIYLVGSLPGTADGQGLITFIVPEDPEKAERHVPSAGLDVVLNDITENFGQKGFENFKYALTLIVHARVNGMGITAFQKSIEMTPREFIRFYLGAHRTGIRILATGDGNVNNPGTLTLSSVTRDIEKVVPTYKFQVGEEEKDR